MKKIYINEIELCYQCAGTGKVRKNEKELYFDRFGELYKDCPVCLGKRVLKKTGYIEYETI